jgi:hypothetical protein
MSSSDTNFKQNYQNHIKHLKLKGLQPKTIEAYRRYRLNRSTPLIRPL